MNQVYDYLLKDLCLKTDDIIVVGCSGGPDSMALLYILKEIRKNLNIKIVCSHVNHNVRKKSFKEKIFLENWCNKENIVFESMIIEKYGDDNFHNEARTIRYGYFESIAKKYKANYLMTAHHGDDLMETILMRIARGSTLNGYSGFRLDVDMGDYHIIRPLIFVTKKEIEEFDKKNKIPFVIDNSNKKDKYTRNRYRKHVLPFFKKENPRVHEKFLKYSIMLEEYNDYIDNQVKKVFNKVFDGKELDIPKYNELDKLLKSKIIYELFSKIYHDDLMLVNDKHVELVQSIIDSNKKNAYIYLPNNVKVLKAYDKISFIEEGQEVNNYEIELIDYALLPNDKHIEVVEKEDSNGNDICRLDSSDITLPLYIRTRKHGDKMSLKGTDGHKKVKDIFIDSKIPINEREIWPIVVDAKGNVLWIPGLKKSKFNKQKSEKCDIIIKYY